jgi:hypothetical protein
MAGWHSVNGVRKYFYGFGVPLDYNGDIPEGFTVKEFPASYYLAFFHPPFDYLKDNIEVMGQVESLAWNYNIEAENFNSQKYQWNEEVCQDYQRHCPEVLGYEILRPVKRK